MDAPPPPPPARAVIPTGPETMTGSRWRLRTAGAWWRILLPLGAVVLGLATMVAAVLAQKSLGAGEDARNIVGVAIGSATILLVGACVLRAVSPAQRRVMLAYKGRLRSTIAIGFGIGAAILVGSAMVIGAGSWLDDGARRALEDAQPDLANVWWQSVILVVALVVLAPLGEETLFRALELRGLVRLVPFAVAAPISGILFMAAHFDAWIAWPRALALIATGLTLAWLYRWRGWPASVTAHATVNAVAAIALIAQA